MTAVDAAIRSSSRTPSPRPPLRARAGAVMPHVLLLAYVVVACGPIALIVMNSFKSRQAIFEQPFALPTPHTLALSGFQRMWYVILPQAFRIAVPPLGNQYLNLLKNSSLGAAIGYYDLTLVTQTTVGNGSPAVPAFVLTMAVYVLVSLVVSFFVNLANRRLRLVER